MASSSAQRVSSYADARTTGVNSSRRMASSNAERKTEKTITTTRETYTVRTKSPVKTVRESLAGSKRGRDGEKVAQRTEEKVNRKEEPRGMFFFNCGIGQTQAPRTDQEQLHGVRRCP